MNATNEELQTPAELLIRDGLEQFPANVGNLTVTVTGTGWLRHVLVSSDGPPAVLALHLDRWCTNEQFTASAFELDGVRWLLGDGDDSSAVDELSDGQVSIWLRNLD